MPNFKKLDYQVELAEKIVRSLDKNDIAICAIPCGYGKTGIAYWLHKLYGKRSIILNHNRILVDQYDELYHDIDDIGCVKGKSNYLCPLDTFAPSVEFAPCQYHRFNCFKRAHDQCEYFNLRKKFDKSSLGITNYQMLLSLLEADAYSRENNALLICDECHNLDAILCDYKTVRINESFLESISRLVEYISEFNDLALIEDSNRLLEFITEVFYSINENNYHKNIDELFTNIMILISMGERLIKRYEEEDSVKSRVKNSLLKIAETIAVIDRVRLKYIKYLEDIENEIEYVYQEVKINGKASYTLTPVYVGNYFNQILSQVCEKAVLMSGTVINQENLKRTLGIDKKKTAYFDIPSLYDKENRPILFCNTAGLNKNNSVQGSREFNLIINEMKTIIEHHTKKNESGVVFIPSYALGASIRESLEEFLKKLKIQVFSNSSAEDSAEILDQFCHSKKKKRILISPSFEEGVNFNDDISRYQIIVKTPYLYLGDKRVKAKMERDKDWYETATMTRIIQSSARSVRNKKDYATTYILDTNSYRLYNKMKNYCPQWFNEAVVEM